MCGGAVVDWEDRLDAWELELDLNARGMGWRSQRYALVAEDGKVTHLGVEAPGGFEVSKAEAILAAL